MPGRNANPTTYRHGFNGMEKDDELKGNGNSYDFGARMYDPRVGRWLALDPMPKANESPYVGFSNNPIWFVDPDGRDTLKMHRSEKLTPEQRTDLFGTLEGLDKVSDLDVYIVTFTIVERGVERRVGETMYMFFDPKYDVGSNSLPKKNYTLTFGYMPSDIEKRRHNDINVTSFGVWIHPGNNCESFKGCYGLSQENPTVSDNGYLTFAYAGDAQKKVREIYNKSNGGANGNDLTGAKFILETNSVGKTQVMDLKPRKLPRIVEKVETIELKKPANE